MAGVAMEFWQRLTRLARVLEIDVAPLRRAMSDNDARHILAEFREAERRGIMLASFVRALIILGLIAVFAATGQMRDMGYLFLVFSPLGLAVIGLVQYALERNRLSPLWAKYAFVFADCVYLTLMLSFRHHISEDLPTATVTIKEGGILFFFAFLVHGAFTYSPRFVLWTGLCISAGWLTILAVALGEPGTTITFNGSGAAGMAIWERYGAPQYLPLMKVIYDYVVLFFLTIGLAVAVARSRRLVLGAAEAERSRANLARHFSPKMVDVATRLGGPAFVPVRQDAAILFADIRGFTSLAERQSPEQTVALLSRYHARMQEALFARNGTLDRIMGDGLLATFGVPAQAIVDATSAFDCARDMLDAVNALNAQFQADGLPMIEIGVGLHYGPVMFGDIGSARMATFTVVGDTVNVASRLQSMTRTLGAPIAMSARFAQRLHEEGAAHHALSSLVSRGSHEVRGRQGVIEVFTVTPNGGPTVATLAAS